jgi:hypothetical protein
MAIRLNHTIVAAHDKEASAIFLTDILGLAPPMLFGPFAVVHVGDDTSLDYINVEDYQGAHREITSQHYAFLVSELEFDAIFARIRERRLPNTVDLMDHSLTGLQHIAVMISLNTLYCIISHLVSLTLTMPYSLLIYDQNMHQL